MKMEVEGQIISCQDRSFQLHINRPIACQGCVSTGRCQGPLQITIDGSSHPANESWQVGDQVAISSVNFCWLIILSYLLPFAIFFALLLLGKRWGGDLLAFFLGASALAVYYLALWACKQYLAGILFYKITKLPTR